MANTSPLKAGIIFFRMHKTSILFTFLLIAPYIGFVYIVHRHPICWGNSVCNPLTLSQQSIITMGSIVAAVTGWIITSWVSLRNTKRQHTITVLLQSRLSQAYQQRMKDAIAIYPVTPNLTLFQECDLNCPEKKEAIEGIKYLLNYFEFIAVGIKYGDLDEKTLRQSMRGILNTLVTISDIYIKYSIKKYPLVYEHLLWLNNKWRQTN